MQYPQSGCTITDNNYFKADFEGFKKYPTVEIVFTVTPSIGAAWPSFDKKYIKETNDLPVWLKRHHVERGLLQKIEKYIQMTLSAGVGLYVKATLDLCTEECQMPTPLQIGIEAGIDGLTFTFGIFSFEFEYTIEFNIKSPEFFFCVPFIDLCQFLVKGDGNYLIRCKFISHSLRFYL